MAQNLGELEYGLSVSAKDAIAAIQSFVDQVDQAEVELGRLDAQAKKSSQTFKKNLASSVTTGSKAVLGFVTAVAAAGAALATFSLKEAAEFQTRMTNVSTLLDLSTEEMARFGDEVLDLSRRVPVSGSVLSESLYDVVSAGITDSADAMIVLEQAAKLGTAGIGTTASATDVLTSALNAFQLDAEDAERISNVLFETVQAGKTTIDELAQSFGQVAPAANAAGVTFEELQAATAALTTSGLSTSVAQTQLRALFIELNREGTKLDKAFESIGVSNVQAAVASDGFVEVLANLQDELGLTDIELQNLFGSVEAGGAAISLLGAQNEAFQDSLGSLTDDVSSLDAAFEKQTATLKSQVQLFKNEFNRILINAGTKVLPVLSDALKEFRGFLDENSQQIEQFIEGIGTLAATILERGVKAIFSLTEFFLKNEQAIYVAAGAITAALIPAVVSMVSAMAPAIATVGALAAAGGLLVFFGTEIAEGFKGLTSAAEEFDGAMEDLVDDTRRFSNESTANVVEFALEGQKALFELSLNGGNYTENLRDRVVGASQGMSSEFTGALEQMVSESETQFEKLNELGLLTDAELTQVKENLQTTAQDLTETNKAFADEIELISQRLGEIGDIQAAGFNTDALVAEQEALTQRLNDALTSQRDNLLTITTDSTDELLAIQRRLSNDRVRLTNEAAEEIAMATIAERDATVAAAQEKYESLIGFAQQQLEIGTLSEEQAQRIIDAARDERDGVVGAAQEMSELTLDEVQRLATEQGLLFDRSTGEITELWEALWESIVSAPKELGQEMLKIVSFILKLLLDGFILWIEDLFKFFTQTLPRFFNWAKDAGQKLIDGLKTLPPRIEQFGRDTIQGFIDGLTAKYQEAVASVTQFGQNIIAGVKSTLGIQSPSKVFREFGDNTAEGFLLGFLDGQQDSIDAMETFVSGLIEEGEKVNQELDFTQAFRELERVVGDAYDEASDAVREFARDNQKAQEDIRDDLDKTVAKIADLKGAFAEDTAEAEADFTTDAAELVLQAQERLQEIADELKDVKIEANIARAEGGNTADFTEQTRALEAERSEQLDILRTAKDLELNLEEEIARQKEFNSLNELEQLSFKYQEEQRRREEAFQTELQQLQEQKIALEQSLAEREAEWQDFTSQLEAVNSDFTAVYQDELAKREELTRASVDKLVAEYARLEAAARSARSAGANISGVGGFAEGGFTGFGQDNEVAGKVHKNEYVAPAWLVRSAPQLFSALEGLRTGAAPMSSPVTNQSFNFQVQNNNQGDADMYRDINRMRWLTRFAF